jgi:hypothetical protein
MPAIEFVFPLVASEFDLGRRKEIIVVSLISITEERFVWYANRTARA